MRRHKSQWLADDLERDDCRPEIRNASAEELRRLYVLLVEANRLAYRRLEKIKRLKAKLQEVTR